VVVDHVNLREHSDVVVLERRHDVGPVPALLVSVHHHPAKSGASQA